MFKTIALDKSQRLKIIAATNELMSIDGRMYELLEIAKIDVSEEVPTACVFWDKKSKLFSIIISKDFLDTMSAKELACVLCHELYHILFDHVVFDIKDTEGYDHEIMNTAQDAIINECIGPFKKCAVVGNPILDARVKLPEIGNGRFSVAKHTSQDVYDYLYANRKEMPKSKLLDDHSTMLGNGEADKDGPGQEIKEKIDKISNGGGELSAESDKEIAKKMIESVIRNIWKGSMGTGSMEADRAIQKILQSEYDPKKLLALAIKKTLRGEVKYSFKKPSRKLGDFFRGKVKQDTPKILIVTDLSGSIDDRTIALVNYQHQVLVSQYAIHACWGDTQLMGEKRLKRKQKVNLPFRGGGGTDLNFYTEVSEREQFDLIVINTDGFIPPIKRDKYNTPIIFCIYPNGRDVEGYKNIRIEEKK